MSLSEGLQGVYDTEGGWLNRLLLNELSINDDNIRWLTVGNYLYRIFQCDTSVSIGDVVHPSSTVRYAVETNINNIETMSSIGIVIEKPTDTTAKVLIYGFCDFPIGGLTAGKPVFLGADGRPTTDKPSSGWLQMLGMCYEEDYVYVMLNFDRVRLDPFI